MDTPTRALFSLLLLLFHACQGPAEGERGFTQDPATLDQRADSIELAESIAAQDSISATVYAEVETNAILAEVPEDAADDPAIWVHHTEPEKSLVFGSNKRGGIAAYTLRGKEVAYYPVGNINNIDVLYNYQLGDSIIDLLGGTNRSDQSIDLFAINGASGQLTDVAAGPLAVDPVLIDDVYGFCFASYNGVDYVVINGKNGRMEQYQISHSASGVDLSMVRAHQFPGQTEGLVADEAYNRLYVGQEDGGIWRMPIDPDQETEPVLLPESTDANPDLRYDIEGLTLCKISDTSGYLLASSQGSFSYALFERTGLNNYLGSFKISSKGQIDGAEETDGIDVVYDSLSPAFPHGLFVAQDGYNLDVDGQDIPQNFKYVKWGDIESVLFSSIHSGARAVD